MNNFRYAMEIRWSEEDECYVGLIPELPGCMSHGSTPAEVVGCLEEAADAWIEAAKAAKRKIPKPVTAQELVRESRKATAQANEHLRRMIQSAVKKALAAFKEEESTYNQMLGATRGQMLGQRHIRLHGSFAFHTRSATTSSISQT